MSDIEHLIITVLGFLERLEKLESQSQPLNPEGIYPRTVCELTHRVSRLEGQCLDSRLATLKAEMYSQGQELHTRCGAIHQITEEIRTRVEPLENRLEGLQTQIANHAVEVENRLTLLGERVQKQAVSFGVHEEAIKTLQHQHDPERIAGEHARTVNQMENRIANLDRRIDDLAKLRAEFSELKGADFCLGTQINNLEAKQEKRMDWFAERFDRLERRMGEVEASHIGQQPPPPQQPQREKTNPDHEKPILGTIAKICREQADIFDSEYKASKQKTYLRTHLAWNLAASALEGLIQDIYE